MASDGRVLQAKIAAGAAVVVAVAGFVVATNLRCTPEAAPSVLEAPKAARPDVDAAAGTFPVEFRSGPYRLRGDVLKPAGAEAFPAIVYNHGSERDPGLDAFQRMGEFLQSEGYVVFFPYRRGSTGSEGPYWKDEVKKRPDSEANDALVAQLDLHNDDVLAAIDWLAAQPYVDRDRIAVAGCSFGGIETVLAAERSPHVYAAVDFAGASASWASMPPLQERLKKAVRSARVPILFLQAENDFDTTPSRVLSAEMSAAGKPNAMRIFPPYGKTAMEGHARFCNRGMMVWAADVLAFLAKYDRQAPR
jgi:dienelactone hydrolase